MSILPFNSDDLDAILFDLDGTLIDTDNHDVAKWAQRAARVYRDPARAQRQARRLVMGIESPVNAAFTVFDWLGLDAPLMRLMIALQGIGSIDDLPVIPGVESMLRQLAQHYKLGIVSTRTVKEQHQFTHRLGLEDQIAAYAGRDSTWRIKPHPQPVLTAAQQLGVEPERCLMVGDTTVDIRAGTRAGAWTCGVLCGYGMRDELEAAGVDFLLPETANLADVLLNGRDPGCIS